MKKFIIILLGSALVLTITNKTYADDKLQSRIIKSVKCDTKNVCTFTTLPDVLHKNSITFTFKATANITIKKLKGFIGQDVVIGFTGNVNKPKVSWIMLADND